MLMNNCPIMNKAVPISKGLKQDRTLRPKANANKQSTLWWLLTQIKDLLITFGIGNLTTWQVTTILLGTYFLWPKLKPNMRLLLNRMHLQVLSARDMIVSKVATHLIGLRVILRSGTSLPGKI